MHKRLEGRAVFAEVQDPLPRLADELGGAVDDFLQHRPDAPPLGRVAHRAGFSQKADLADEAQAVVGQHPQVRHEVVAVELGRRQALQAEVGLDRGTAPARCGTVR